MKMKNTFTLFLAVLCLLVVSTTASAIQIDGVFDESVEWAGHYAADDGVGGSGYVGPGYGGQSFDVEYLGLKIEGGKVYFGLQTGFNLKDGVTYGGYHYRPGDFTLEVTGDSVHDYAIDFSFSGSTPVFSLYEVSSWQNVMYSSHAAANPYQYSTGTLIPAVFEGAYGSGVFANNSDGGTSYVLEGSFDLALLTLYSYGDPILLHWTMECGNDYLVTTGTPVPEPSTLLLLGSGLSGLFFTRVLRRSKKG